MNRLRLAWDGFWHGDPVNELSLDVFRIFFYASLLVVFSTDYYGRFFVNLGWAPAELVQPTPLEPLLGWVKRSAENHETIRKAFLVSCALSASGFLSPLSKAVAAALGIYILNALSSFGNWNHTLSGTAIALLLLCLVPCSYRLSIDRRLGILTRGEPEVWLFKLIQVSVIWSYFSSGLYKLAAGGPAWIAGNSFRNYLIRSNYLEKHTQHEWLAAQLIAHPWLCWILGAAALGIELICPIALFSARWRTPVFLTLAAMQVMIYFTLKENFVMAITLLPAVFHHEIRRLSPGTGKR